MSEVWCVGCGADGSLARAVASLPCPVCGAEDWFVAVSEDDGDSLLDLSERMQRLGCWDVAESALVRCRDLGFITQADYRLSVGALRWRQKCASFAAKLFSAGLDADDLREKLSEEFDALTADWLLKNYVGLSLEVDHGKET